MTADEIRTRMHAAPFRPFDLRLTDGERIHIPHPDFIAVGTRLATVNLPDDNIRILEIPLITAIEITTTRTTGKARKPRGQDN